MKDGVNTGFPYKIGLVARQVFPELFRRKLLSKQDVSFLLSGRSGNFFKTRKELPLLKQRITGDESERLVNGQPRYYENCIVQYSGCDYYFTKEWWGEYLDILLGWSKGMGLTTREILALCERATAGKHPGEKKLGNPSKVSKRVDPCTCAKPSSESAQTVAEGNRRFSMCKYVKDAFVRLEASGHKFSPGELREIQTKEWALRTFHVWMPILAPFDLVAEKRVLEGRKKYYSRYWNRPFVFNGKPFAICGQWYARQKPFFDSWFESVLGTRGPVEDSQKRVLWGRSGDDGDEINIRVDVSHRRSIRLG